MLFKLFSIIMLAIYLPVFAQDLQSIQTQGLPSESIILNSGFESGKYAWTIGAGTVSTESSVVVKGKNSLKVVSASQALSVAQSSTKYAAQYADGVQGLVSMMVKTNHTGTCKVCSVSAGVVSSSNCVNVQANNKWGYYKVPTILGGTSNGVSLACTSGSGTTYVDDAFVGKVDLSADLPLGRTQQYQVNTTSTASLTGGTSYGVTDLFTVGASIVTVNKRIRLSVTQSANLLSTDLPIAITIGGSVSTQCLDRGRGTATTYYASCSLTADLLPGDTIQFSSAASANNGIFISAVETVPSSMYSATNADTDWASCGHTPSDFTGFGTVTNIETECKRQGGDLLMRGRFTSGLSTATEARVNLKLGGIQLTSRTGGSIVPVGGLATSIVQSGIYTVLSEPSVGYVTFGTPATSTVSPLDKRNGSNLLNNGNIGSFETVRIPISGWTNSNFIIGQFNGLEKCTDSYECTDTFSAKVSASGVVSDENIDWINGNCSLGATGYKTCNFNTGIFTVAPNCTATNSDSSSTTLAWNIEFITGSPTATGFTTVTATTGDAHSSFNIICQKTGADYTPKSARAVASDQNVRSIGAVGVDIQSVSFGSGANCATSCSTSPCTICNQVGTKITSVSRTGAGIYRVNGIDGLKYSCTGSGTTNGYIGLAHIRNNSTSSYAEIQSGNLAGSNADSANNSLICIGIP